MRYNNTTACINVPIDIPIINPGTPNPNRKHKTHAMGNPMT
jgi:hypothetical protein